MEVALESYYISAFYSDLSLKISDLSKVLITER